MKKLLLTLALLLLPLTSFAATAVPWQITNLTDTFIKPTLVNGNTKGIGVFASSTIGNGTATGGLTINGIATTTLGLWSGPPYAGFNSSLTNEGAFGSFNNFVELNPVNDATAIVGFVQQVDGNNKTGFGMFNLSTIGGNSSNATGMQSVAQTYGTSANGNLIGAQVAADNAGTGLVTTATGLDVSGEGQLIGINGPVTTFTGVNIHDTPALNVTNVYGLRIQQHASSTAYGIYEDGTAQNYLKGFLGLGTSSPQVQLDIEGNSAGGDLVHFQNDDNTGYSDNIFNDNHDIGKLSVGYGNSGSLAPFAGNNFLQNFGTDLLVLGASDGTQVNAIFKNTGAVGIGTTKPTEVNANAHITVAGTGSQDYVASTTDNTTLSDAIYNAYAPGSRVFLGAHGTNQVSTQYGITAGGWGELGALNSSFGTSNGLMIGTRTTATPIVFGTNSAERMRILSNGNVGVGTTTPWKLLSVGTGNVGAFAISTSTSGCATFSSLGELYSTGSNCNIGTVTSVTGTWPIISSGGATPAISFGGLSTSTVAVVGNIPYFSGVNTFANVATSTPTITNGLTYSGTQPYFVGGTSGNLGLASIANGSILGYVGAGSGVPVAIATSSLNLGSSALANTTVTAGSYTNTNLTVNAQGQITAASNGSGSGTSFAWPFTVEPTGGVSTSTLVQFLANSTSTQSSSGLAYFGKTSTSSFNGAGILNIADQAQASTTWMTLATTQGAAGTPLLVASSSSSVGDLFLGLFSGNKVTSATKDTGFGYQALNTITTGGSNTCIGYKCGASLTTAVQNTAIGDNALSSANMTTAASRNAVVGYNIGGSTSGAGFMDNAMLGANIGGGLNDGAQQTVIIGSGAEAQGNNSGHAQTICIGYKGCGSLTTGYSNIFIGGTTNANNLTTGSRNVTLANNPFFETATINDQLNIGGLIWGSLPATSSAFKLPTSGAIGIGTSTPFGKFTIATNNGDTIQNLFLIASSTASATSTLFGITSAGHQYASSTAPTVSSGSVDGTDYYGRVLSCSSTCTVTFAVPFTKIPSCIVQLESGSITNTLSYTPAVGSLAVTETSLGTFDYICHGQ